MSQSVCSKCYKPLTQKERREGQFMCQNCEANSTRIFSKLVPAGLNKSNGGKSGNGSHSGN